MTEERETYSVPGRLQIREACRLPFTDPHFCEPGPDDFRALLQQTGLTGARAGELVGVDGRTIRRYVGGERKIPYSVWRLLLVETGEAFSSSRSAAAE